MRAIAGLRDVPRRAGRIDVGAWRESGMPREEVVALRERLRMRSHDAELVERHARQREQAVLDRADDFAGDVQRTTREEVVRLVDRSGRGVLDRQQCEVRGAVEDRLRSAAKRVEAREQRAAGAPCISPLRREMRIAALDTLIRDAQWNVLACTHVRLLVCDGHVHHHAIHALDLMRIHAGLDGEAAQSRDQRLLALAIAKRRRAGELRLDDALDDLQAIGEQRDDLAIDLVDTVTERREIWSRHARTVLSWRP